MSITNKALRARINALQSERYALEQCADRYQSAYRAPIGAQLPGTVENINRQRAIEALANWEAEHGAELAELRTLVCERRNKTRSLPQHATLPAENTSNGWWQDNKEQTSFWQVVALKDGEFRHPVTVRVWYGRSRNASTCYAAIWASNRTRSLGGSGSAGGYGYHRESAAVDAAIRSAGITLRHAIHGVGESAIKDALTAIAKALGYHKITIVHG